MNEFDYEAIGLDDFGDRYKVAVTRGIDMVELHLDEDDKHTEHNYTPDQARKLRKQLKRAIRVAEGNY